MSSFQLRLPSQSLSVSLSRLLHLSWRSLFQRSQCLHFQSPTHGSYASLSALVETFGTDDASYGFDPEGFGEDCRNTVDS